MNDRHGFDATGSPLTLWPPHELPEAVSRRNEKPMALGDLAIERRKELGAFYTPPQLVSALVHWAVRSPQDRVLEPAAGEAAFLLAAASRLRALGARETDSPLVGVEIDGEAMTASRAVLAAGGNKCEILWSDFFDLSPSLVGAFDAVIGNPPYIRYHRFRGDARSKGLRAAAAAGVFLTGLSSSWAPFVVHASRFLRSGGRLAFVLPAELLHVDYASPVRKFLLREFGSVTVITFEEAVFPGAMIDTVLLLAEKGATRGLRVLRVSRIDELDQVMEQSFSEAPTDRWSVLRVATGGPAVLEVLGQQERLLSLGSVASVDIGCVTGANEYFVLSLDDIRRWDLDRRTFRPVIARPSQLPGAVLTSKDGEDLKQTLRCWLLSLNRPALDSSPGPVGRYLRHGVEAKVHQRYKCQVRRPWYVIPGVRVPDAFLSYMSNRIPRLSLNEAGFTSTNLVHQLTFRTSNRADRRAWVAALHSSVSLLSFELEGRSYGGGVLKLETREAERVRLPALSQRLREELVRVLPVVDGNIRNGNPEQAADAVDDVLQRHGMLSAKQLKDIRASHAELRDRRVTRARTGR